MKTIKLSDMLASEESTLKEVIRVIDRAGQRTAYIVDNNKTLAGVVTDSDVRRAIIKGVNPGDVIGPIINRTPVVIEKENFGNILEMRKKVRTLVKLMGSSEYILLINKKRKPLKLISIAEILSKETHFRSYVSSNKRILVVGGAGYLGSVLVRKLIERHYKVRILDNLLYGPLPLKDLVDKKRIELIKGDVRNISTIVRALDNIDAVVNLAALVGDPACRNKPQAAIETNYFANKVLAEICKYNQINRYIFASTCSVYGQMKGGKPLDESSQLNPVSLYARSKIQSEEGILSLVDDNFSPTILRMSTLYGISPRMRFDLVVNTMVKTAILEKKVYVKNGGLQWRPLLHVEDAAGAYIHVLESQINKVAGEVFNVGSSRENFRIIDIARAVKKTIPNTKVLIEKTSGDNRNYFVDFSKIRKALNFSPQHSLRKEIKVMYKILKNQTDLDFDNQLYYNSDFKM